MKRAISTYLPLGVTVLFALAMGASGLGDLMHAPAISAGLHALGYPPYLMTLLGVWKLLGVVALLAPGFPRIREWAYAGFAFELSGAAFSHFAAGDAANVAPALVLFALGMASWRLRNGGWQIAPASAAQRRGDVATA